MKGQYTFQQRYLQRCNELGKPLDKVQVNALEEVVSELSRNGEKFSQNAALERVDYSLITKIARSHNYSHPGSVFRGIRYHRSKKSKTELEKPVTNLDALSLYNASTIIKNAKPTDKGPSVSRRKARTLSRNFSVPTYDILRDYLYAKGLIPDDELSEKLSIRVNQLGFDQRTIDVLNRMDISSLRDLLQYSAKNFIETRDFSPICFTQINKKVKELGFRIGQYHGILPKQTAESEGTPIAELDLSLRAIALLDKLDIRTAEELATYTQGNLMRHVNFGLTSLKSVKNALNTAGLSLKSDKE